MLYKEVEVPRKGRCLVASRELPPGTEVLHCRGDAWAVHAPERVACCAYCLERPDNPPGRCTKCKVVRYCSRKCQTADWAGHRQECKSLARLSPTVPGPTLLLAARLLRQVLKETSDTEGRMEGSKLFASLERLHHHEEALTADRRSLLVDMAKLVREILVGDDTLDERVFESLQPDYIVRLICRISCNAMTITDAECRPVGMGLFLGGVAANHSCRPNCFALFEGPVLRLRTMRQVRKDEELCIAYIDVTAPKAIRHQELKDNYFFNCQCGRCQSGEADTKEEVLDAWLCTHCGGACVEKDGEAELFKRWKSGALALQREEVCETSTAPRLRACTSCGKQRPDVEEVMSELEQAQKEDKNGFEMYRQGEVEAAVRYYAKALRVYERHLHPLHHLRHGLNARLSFLNMGLQDFATACKYSKASLRHLEFVLPAVNPITGLENLLLGKLEYHLEHADEAIKHLQSAVTILRITHGDDHPLVSTAFGLLKEVEGEIRRVGRMS